MGDADRRWVDSMPDAYERHLVAPVFQPFAADLTDRITSAGPRRVLELAAGTGVLTRTLAATLSFGAIVATDLNDSMVAFGCAHVPGVTWQQADALELPFPDGEFDVVACAFGIMFFPDKVRAFGEARRVLAPGGLFLATTWGELEAHEFQAAVVAATDSVCPEDPPRFLQSIPHGYHDAATIESELRAAGFSDVSVEPRVLEGHAPSAKSLAVGFCTGTPLRAELEARGDLAELTSQVAAAVEDRLGSGPVTGCMRALVVSARVA